MQYNEDRERDDGTAGHMTSTSDKTGVTEALINFLYSPVIVTFFRC